LRGGDTCALRELIVTTNSMPNAAQRYSQAEMRARFEPNMNIENCAKLNACVTEIPVTP
jgi:hypothetical protein